MLGIALILGLATRYAAFAGAFLVINFWFAKGLGFFGAMNHDVVWLSILLVLALMKAGHVYGLDGQLKNKYSFLGRVPQTFQKKKGRIRVNPAPIRRFIQSGITVPVIKLFSCLHQLSGWKNQ